MITAENRHLAGRETETAAALELARTFSGKNNDWEPFVHSFDAWR